MSCKTHRQERIRMLSSQSKQKCFLHESLADVVSVKRHPRLMQAISYRRHEAMALRRRKKVVCSVLWIAVLLQLMKYLFKAWSDDIT